MKPGTTRDSESSQFEKFVESLFVSASTTLSTLLKERFRPRLVRITETDFVNFQVSMENPSKQMHSVIVGCEGDIQLHIMFLINSKDTKFLAQRLLPKRESRRMSNLGKSSISETGNILAGSLLSNLANRTGLSVWPSVPGLAFDFVGSLVQTPLSELASRSESLVFVEGEFIGIESSLRLQLLMILESVSARKLMSSLQVHRC